MSEIKLFPIGYIASTNSSSKGAWTSGGTEVNLLFEPNDGCSKQQSGYTAISDMENRIRWTRKVAEFKHTITYKYENIWNTEFKQIRRFFSDIAQQRTNSFYVVDFSSGRKINNLATGANWNASVIDTTDFSATTAEGGNYCCVWYPDTRSFRIGIVNSKAEDSSITFPNSSDFGDLQQFVNGRVYLYPVYRVYCTADNLEFETSGYVDADQNASFAGPVYSGTISFIQRDVK